MATRKEMKPDRVARRQKQRSVDNVKQEQNRQRAIGGGQPNELGITQGQNGEQGNTINPENAKPIGRSAH
jgi:hypothetical protein